MDPDDAVAFSTEPVMPDTRDRAGERADLEAAWAAHAGDLYSFALRTTRDHDTAEDAVAEAFARLLKEWRRGRRPEKVGGWLMRVTANVILSGRRRRAVADRWNGILRRREASAAPDPAQELVIREARSELEATLSVLGPDARAAMLLAARGFSCGEIATMIGRTYGATRTLLCRSRMRMREVLESGEVTR
jgi:RNA polymerase sigma factor (sigma-70 family)